MVRITRSFQTHAEGVYGIRPKVWMESSRSDVWHQSEGKIHAGARCHTPTAITYSPAVRFHTNPSDWIEKRPFENGLFSVFTAQNDNFCEKLSKKPFLRSIFSSQHFLCLIPSFQCNNYFFFSAHLDGIHQTTDS